MPRCRSTASGPWKCRRPGGAARPMPARRRRCRSCLEPSGRPAARPNRHRSAPPPGPSRYGQPGGGAGAGLQAGRGAMPNRLSALPCAISARSCREIGAASRKAAACCDISGSAWAIGIVDREQDALGAELAQAELQHLRVEHPAGADPEVALEIFARHQLERRLVRRHRRVAVEIVAPEPIGDAFPHMAEHDPEPREAIEHPAHDQPHRVQPGLRIEAPQPARQRIDVVEGAIASGGVRGWM